MQLVLSWRFYYFVLTLPNEVVLEVNALFVL